MHPDRGGDTHAFQAMQTEYEQKLKDMLSGARKKRSFISKQEAMELGQMLAEFLKKNRPSLWSMVRNITTQPLAAALLAQFAPKEVTEYAKLLGLID